MYFFYTKIWMVYLHYRFILKSTHQPKYITVNIVNVEIIYLVNEHLLWFSFVIKICYLFWLILCRLPFLQRHIVLPVSQKTRHHQKFIFLWFLCLKILHRTWICWPQIYCLLTISLSLSLSLSLFSLSFSLHL